MISKLAYNVTDAKGKSAEGHWNQRPRDAANLMNWMSHQFERQINFQVVGIDTDAEEWLDAPVLLITGSKDPKFTNDDVEKLRQFVRMGGLIFSCADLET